MFEVILIDKDNSIVGHIGKYDTEQEAQSEANNYNRKADRHRGYAVVQAIIGGQDEDSDDWSENEDSDEELPTIHHHTVRQNPRGIRLGSQHRERSVIPERPSKTVIPKRPIESEKREPRMVHRFQEARERPYQNPSENTVVERSNTAPQESSEPTNHLLVYDNVKDKHLVLQDGAFTRQLILTGYGRYDVVDRGDFYKMIAERNRRLK